MTHKIRLGAHHPPLSRAGVKNFVRDRIGFLRMVLDEFDAFDIGEKAKWEKRLRNRCEQLRELHRLKDW